MGGISAVSGSLSAIQSMTSTIALAASRARFSEICLAIILGLGALYAISTVSPFVATVIVGVVLLYVTARIVRSLFEGDGFCFWPVRQSVYWYQPSYWYGGSDYYSRSYYREPYHSPTYYHHYRPYVQPPSPPNSDWARSRGGVPNQP